MFKQMKHIFQFFGLSITLAAVALSLMPTGIVSAMPPADDANPPQVNPLPDDTAGVDKQIALGRVFKREQQAHERQEKAIDKAGDAADRISEMIARAKENGKDTAELEKSLAVFNTRIGEIRLKYDQTGKLIKQHEGFDDKGKVTDETKAKATVDAVHKGNQDVRQSLAEAIKGLREADKAFRQANPRPTGIPKTSPV